MIELRELVEKLHAMPLHEFDDDNELLPFDMVKYNDNCNYQDFLWDNLDAIKNYLWEYQELQD